MFDTHFEAYSDLVRNAQAAQLMQVTAASTYLVLVVGDMNSRPTGCGQLDIYTGAYSIITKAGLEEV